MPKKGLTHITYIIDRSGSMEPLAGDVIGGFNSFLKDQSDAPGEATLSLVLFDNQVDFLCDGVPIKQVAPLNNSTYCARATTALLDAVHMAIERTGNRLSAMKESDRPEKVMVVIMTDGLENASTMVTRESLAARIRHQEQKYSWNFVFMGANQDAFAEASGLGIRGDMVANFAGTSKGTSQAYDQASKGMLRARGSNGARVQGYFTPDKN
jgi:uncharacterized protein YegL